MSSGDVHYAAGSAYELIETINLARHGSFLVAIERDFIPTGQIMYIDPKSVESVKDD